MKSLLEVRGLTKAFPVRLGIGRVGRLSAVDEVSLQVEPGTTMGIVGESGCGKSTLARLILGLVETDSGEIAFEQQVVDWRKSGSRKQLRRNMQMVFQNPYSSLNPRGSIGEIIAFPMRAHGVNRAQIAERTADLLAQVGLHANHASYYPHQLSGGQRQRVNIARALALHPKLVVCDEAVAALDKSVQAQVLNLLQDSPSGCRFRTRCPHAMQVCCELRPAMREREAGHQVACHLYPLSTDTLMEVLK